MKFTDLIPEDKVISESGFEDRFEYISNTLQTAIETMMDEDEFVGKANTRQIQKLNPLVDPQSRLLSYHSQRCLHPNNFHQSYILVLSC